MPAGWSVAQAKRGPNDHRRKTVDGRNTVARSGSVARLGVPASPLGRTSDQLAASSPVRGPARYTNRNLPTCTSSPDDSVATSTGFRLT